MIDKAEIAKRIVELRGARSKVECAEFLGMDYNTYRDYEFARSAKLEVLAAISEKFGVALDWLVLGRGPKYAEGAVKPPEPYGDIPGRDINLLIERYISADKRAREDALAQLEKYQVKEKGSKIKPGIKKS